MHRYYHLPPQVPHPAADKATNNLCDVDWSRSPTGGVALLLLLPVSGYVIWVWMKAPMDVFGLFDLPRLFTPPKADETGRAIAWYLHYWGGWALVGLVTLHVSAALWHQFVRRDGLIGKRML